jgi:hypothetical protein
MYDELFPNTTIVYKNLIWPIQHKMWLEDSHHNSDPIDSWNNFAVDLITNIRTPDLYIKMFPADSIRNQINLLEITLQIQDPNGSSIERCAKQSIFKTKLKDVRIR